MRRVGVAAVGGRTQDIDNDVEVVAVHAHNLEGTCSDHRARDVPPVLPHLAVAEEAPAAARSIRQRMDVEGNDDAEDASDVDMAVDDQT